jgi:hypothetical protein
MRHAFSARSSPVLRPAPAQLGPTLQCPRQGHDSHLVRYAETLATFVTLASIQLAFRRLARV